MDKFYVRTVEGHVTAKKTTDGMTKANAEIDAKQRNAQAEELGINTRYEVAKEEG